MQYVPVDTIICFRASCPIVIAIIEYFYLDRELPSLRSWGALLGGFAPLLPARHTKLLAITYSAKYTSCYLVHSVDG